MQACARPVARMRSRATSMLAAKAYIHQYEAFGLSLQDMQAAVNCAEETVCRYDQLG